MKVLQLNHIAIFVEDVAVSEAFYRDVLKLPQMPRPNFDFPGAWFRLAEDQELHLIGDPEGSDRARLPNSEPANRCSRGNHFALMVDELDSWEAHIDSMGATREARKTRPDGAEQTFLPDPDGHWIELSTAPPKIA